jgi:tryptophan 2,3-dioxygenase
MYYSDYLQLDKILGAQELESDKVERHAHDEMLFIIIHQSYELWFKQIMFEVDSVHRIMSKPTINDNSPELMIVSRRLFRVVEILRVLVHKVDILETMTPLDFLDFRDLLRPASGFQSMQFKILEAKLGLKMEHRHGQEYYTSQLDPMPFLEDKRLWENGNDKAFWNNYRETYSQSLGEGEKLNMQRFDDLFMTADAKEGVLSDRARRAAMFILLYRDYPLLQNPYRIINLCLEVDELLATWRWRHMNMVHRMIGTRAGTGGSTGKGYLREAALKHYVFGEFAELNSFMVERRKLPVLTKELEKVLSFQH